MRTSSALIVLAVGALLLSSCDEPVSPNLPETSVMTSQGVTDGEVTKVTGDSELLLDGERRTFSFVAKRMKNGQVTGEFHVINRQLGVKVHGDVTCYSVSGNEAWIGGEMEREDLPPAFPDDEAGWRIEDQKAPVKDRTSLATAFSDGEASEYCSNQPRTGTLQEVVGGNIMIHR